MLCCGIIVSVLGLRYMLGPHPPAGIPISIPTWNWWGIAYAMAAGFVPLIPIRGMHKLLARMNRMITGRWTGWSGILFKEGLLILAALSIGWGFHHVFKGAVPFTAASWHEIHEALEAGHHPLGWLLLTLGTVWLLVVRGGYKKVIGEPFIKETRRQTWIKEVLFVVGFLPLFLGFMLLIEGHFGAWNPWPQWLTLPREDQKKLIGTRMQVLLELPDAARDTLLRTHMRLMSGMPQEAQTGEVSILNELMEEMPGEMRAVANEEMGAMMIPMLHQYHSRLGKAYDWCSSCRTSR